MRRPPKDRARQSLNLYYLHVFVCYKKKLHESIHGVRQVRKRAWSIDDVEAGNGRGFYSFDSFGSFCSSGPFASSHPLGSFGPFGAFGPFRSSGPFASSYPFGSFGLFSPFVLVGLFDSVDPFIFD